MNRPDPTLVPEITSQMALFVDNTPDGYRAGLERLIVDAGLRRSQWRNLASIETREIWDPTVTEANYVRIYREIIAASGR